jgi:manganese/zinc/iron transport system ATP- binding protein
MNALPPQPVLPRPIAAPMPAADAPPLAVRGLAVSYGGAPALAGVDLTVPAGSMTAIVGPNGAGKSTLLKAVVGLVPAAAGEVHVFGQPFARVRGRVAYVPQRAAVDWDFPARVIDVVLMGMARELGLIAPVGARHRARARDCLARVGMAGFETRPIGALSGGQQQRVFLARALAQGADLYLLDEPFAGVDAPTEAAIAEVLRALCREGRTVVAVHHDLATLAARFDRALLLNVTALAEGPVAAVARPELLARAYGIPGAAGQATAAGAGACSSTP